MLAGIIFVGLFLGVTIYFGQTSVYPTLSAVPQFGL